MYIWAEAEPSICGIFLPISKHLDVPYNSKATDLSKTYSALGLYEFSQENSTIPRILKLVSCVLERSIQRNDKTFETSKRKDAITVFHSSRTPSLSIQQYLERILKYTRCSPSCFVVAYIYIQRFLQRMDALLTSLNVHRLLITSVMVAAKFVDDECHNNAYFAKVGGVSTEEINRLETKLLFCLDFKLHVDVMVFNKYCLELQREGIRIYVDPTSYQKERSQVRT